jgi:hypothetical protein
MGAPQKPIPSQQDVFAGPGGLFILDEGKSYGRFANEASDVVATSPALRKELDLFDAVAIVVGTLDREFSRSPLAWAMGGILTTFGGRPK